MGKEYNIVIKSCISLWLWYTYTIIILDEGISKKIYRRNKEAYWEGSARELTFSGESQFRKCSCTMWSWLISTARKISREITIREEGVWANDQGSIQQTSNSGQKAKVKNTERWPSQLRNRSWTWEQECCHFESPGFTSLKPGSRTLSRRHHRNMNNYSSYSEGIMISNETVL